MYQGPLFFLLFIALGAQTAWAAAKTALGGSWSVPTNWSPSGVPGAGDTVTVPTGVTQTVDTLSAQSASVTVRGALAFSRVASSSLTLVGGDIAVNSGGTLDMGTAASPIPAGINAQLVLAKGASAGQFGLIVQNGAVFTVQGATKTAATTATSDATPSSGLNLTLAASPASLGWGVGDSITVSPTTRWSGTDQTERTMITAIAGNTITVDSAFANFHYSSWTVQVANLTRNALVRSSGTVVQGAGGNSAYIQNLSQSATSFALAYGEFAYLGSNATSKFGITFDGSGVLGSVSSCSVHEGFDGVYLDAAGRITISNSLFYKNSDSGVAATNSGNNEDIIGNQVYSNTNIGIYINLGTGHRIIGNLVYSNSAGVQFVGGQANSLYSNNQSAWNTNNGFVDASGISQCGFLSNQAYENGDSGFFLNPSNTLFVANSVHDNVNDGFLVNGGANTFIGNYAYKNTALAIDNLANTNLIVGGALGYSETGAAAADGTFEIDPTNSITLEGVRINPVSGINTPSLNAAGRYVLSYNQDYATGTIQLSGDYGVANSTLTLDYATQLYASTATTPILIRGSGHSATICSTNDANAVSQLITIQRVSGTWQVVGSSSGLLGAISSFGGSCPGTALPASNAQFNMTFTQGGSPIDGDTVVFGLIAASGDANVRKKLLLGRAAAGFNSGKSRLTIAPSGGLVLSGIAGTHTLMDMIPGGTYYSFVDSGAFTTSFSSITNADFQGLWLSGTAGVSINNAVFDYIGTGPSTITFITANNLTSNATFTGLTFATSRSTGAARAAYNVRVLGSDSGLSWQINGAQSGNLWGEAFNFDPNNKVTWGSPNSPPGNPIVSAVYLSSVTVAFNPSGASSYVLDASTTSGFTGTVFETTASGSPTSLTVTGLAQNTSYYLRVGALWGSTTFYADPGPATTLVAVPSPLSFPVIGLNGFTMNWQQNANPAGTPYQVFVGTDVNFAVFTASLTSTAFSATFPSLLSNTTYFARVRAVSISGVPSAYALGVAITALAGVITISANRLASVWYAGAGTIFNAQGAVTYRYKVDPSPSYVPGTSDTPYDGSALTIALADGTFYFHVTGYNGSGAAIGTAHLGPLLTDSGQPTIAGLSAQKSRIDPSPIPDGAVTTSASPRFTWAPAASLSPIAGYSLLVSTDPADLPPRQVNITLKLFDYSIAIAGQYYIKVAALNLAGTWGPAVGMSLIYNSVPIATGVSQRLTRFNPTIGNCTKVDLQLATGGHVRIVVYTMLGERVTSVIDQDSPPGGFTYAWCGRNAANEYVASGGYVLHVEAPGIRKNLKAAVVK